jgi:hypothetical protein
MGPGEEILFLVPRPGTPGTPGGGGLEMWCTGKHVRIADAAAGGWVARALFEAYLGGSISPSTAASVASALGSVGV